MAGDRERESMTSDREHESVMGEGGFESDAGDEEVMGTSMPLLLGDEGCA